MSGQNAGPGSQAIYWKEPDELVVEWYDHGESVPYESANMLVLGPSERSQLALSLGLLTDTPIEALARALAERFDSYFDLRTHLDQRRLPYRHEVDYDV